MADALYRYLHQLQHPATGLLESFAASADPELFRVGFTYDLALASIVFTQQGATQEAERLLDFYGAMPMPEPGHTQPFNTAYQAKHGVATLEDVFQVGPLAWVAIALIHHAARGGPQYLRKAVELLDWVRRCVPHHAGGVQMGLRPPWSSRLSVENNWAYYAALRLAIPALADGLLREAFERELRAVRRWLSAHEAQRGGGDPIKALDVYTRALLVGPAAHLEDTVLGDETALARWAKSWIEELEALFRVPNTHGYDYTDAQEAVRIDRPRAGWLEGTAQLIVAYRTWAPFFRERGETAYADSLLRRAAWAESYVLSHRLVTGNAVAIPNTSAVVPLRTFHDGWLARPVTEPAVNGTAWTYFVLTGFNPLTAPLLESPPMVLPASLVLPQAFSAGVLFDPRD